MSSCVVSGFFKMTVILFFFLCLLIHAYKIYLREELLDCKICISLFLEITAMLFPKMVKLIYNSVGSFEYSHCSTFLLILDFYTLKLNFCHECGCVALPLIFIFLIIRMMEHLFLCLFAICISSAVKIHPSFAPFPIRLSYYPQVLFVYDMD